MYNYVIPVLTGVIILLITIIIFLYIRLRRVVEEKNRSIMKHIDRHDSLWQELEDVKIEKIMLEKRLERYVAGKNKTVVNKN
ncbi:MAG: hypothetical protein LBH32_11640 [Dysgonamonadaceae bacterium]|jgi:hypothetical protein|nr:hypothetical protein [Dysgonamonadaceae bacterium]